VRKKQIKTCFGFDKNGDRKATRDNTKSPWDTLNPGREWALDHREDPKRPIEVIIKDIKEHYIRNIEQIEMAPQNFSF